MVKQEENNMQNGYPRPQFVRENWINLNGIWNFSFDDQNIGEKERWYDHFPSDRRKIQVPFSYETSLSGIGEETFHPVVWYQREIELKKTEKRLLLHLEGADYTAVVWVNGQFAGKHTGAYARFS